MAPPETPGNYATLSKASKKHHRRRQKKRRRWEADNATAAAAPATAAAVPTAGTAPPVATPATGPAAAAATLTPPVESQPTSLSTGTSPTAAAMGVTDDMRARFQSFISHLDREYFEILMERLWGGSILDGVESFGEDGKGYGLNNGLFYCFLRVGDAPDKGGYRGDGLVWSRGAARKRFSQNVSIACTKARIPLVLEGDAPAKSPMGEMMQFAATRGVTRLGYIGKTSGRGPLELTEELTDAWRTSCVSEKQLFKTLNGGTFTIDNTEENKKTERTDNTCYSTMKNDAVTAMIREGTRMGELCFPGRGQHRGGKLTGDSADGVKWSGSECMLFAKDGGMTNPHVDVQSVPGGTGKIYHMPAAGIIRRVNHVDTQVSAKQAIVVHADDMSKVIDTLDIDTGKESTSQYGGKPRTLPEFARVLRDAGIRFVVMNFPSRCSYALPARCAHVFITIGLVESAAWHPVFRQDMQLLA